MKLATLLFTALLGANLALAEISQSTISTYNSALASDGSAEEIAIAAEALGKDAIANADDDNAALYAFEAAWTLCRIGAFDKAVSISDFAVQQGNIDDGATPSLEMRTVLASYAAWKAAPSRRTRRSLEAALDTLADGDASPVTITAHQDLYSSYARDGRWRSAARAADKAAAHMEPVADEVSQLYAMA
ncbi:MAG: hypothetical protein AAGJ50_10735, partial [Pseudomonadota bacterium]